MAYKIFIEGKNYDKDQSNGFLSPLPDISTKIKAIDKDKANSEIEKGEIVLDPETGAMHKALGKPHSKGGTPVSLKDNSFIFSNFKDLAINKKEKEIFEFKIGGKYKPINNTPSKIIEKEIDLEHHNKMIDILQNEKKNTKESVNSAKLMMLKNLEKAGQIAFLQESKKGLEAPAFSNDTAPVYAKKTDDQINQSMQYLQKGGKFLQTYQPGGKKFSLEEMAEALKNKLKDVKGWNFRYKEGNKSYYDKPGTVTTQPKRKATPEEERAYAKYKANETIEQKIRRQIRESKAESTESPTNAYGYVEEPVGGDLPRMGTPNFSSIPMSPTYTPPASPFIVKGPGEPGKDAVGNPAGNPKGIVDPKNIKSKLTPWQLINMGIPFYKALNVKTQWSIRQHQESLIPKLDNINVQPQLDVNNQGYFNAASLTRGMNPNQGSAYLQQLYGNRIGANNQAIGNVQQANVATQNNQKVIAANTLNQDAVVNRGFDDRYKREVDTTVKNTIESREDYFNQGMNITNDTVSKKLAFDNWLNSQQQFKGKPTYRDEDGVQHYEGMPLYTPKPGFFGNSVQYNSPTIDWSTYQSSKTSMEDDDAAYVNNIRELVPGISDDKIASLLEQRIKKKSLAAYSAANMQTQSIPTFKKGGKFIPKLRPKKSLY